MTELAEMEMARALGQRLYRGGKAWLFLDYDGTLVEFASTPELVLPDEKLIELIERLSRFGKVLRVVVLSGRKISQIQRLIPVQGILLAGTYGIEFQTWEGENVRLIEMETLRPYIERVKSIWNQMIEGKPGYYLEDKGYAVALHAKNAQPDEAQALIVNAELAVNQLGAIELLRILGGSMFLEVAPAKADKGAALRLLLDRFPWPGAEVLYIGDDDKDEAAFEVVRQIHGTPIVVAGTEHPTHALYRLESPDHVRRWLTDLVDALEQGEDQS